MRSTLASVCALSSLLPLSIAQTAGTFNTLTFNVAGLPPVLNGNDVPGDKTTNTARIGQLFTKYNISLIHVQEDFNFHATLYANDKHPVRTPTSGGVPFGSGLNSLSNFEYTGFQRIKWNTCSTFDSADCLTPKGFTFMRVKIAEGVVIDAYNLHADAGTTDADNKARASNLRQVSDYIKANSIGNAVLVFGDSNSRYTRTDDIPAVFSEQNGMKDTWLQLVRNGVAPAKGADALLCSNPATTNTCEIVDKTWYRAPLLYRYRQRRSTTPDTCFCRKTAICCLITTACLLTLRGRLLIASVCRMSLAEKRALGTMTSMPFRGWLLQRWLPLH
ncbi:hypothetical protein P3342_005340 [Pyrenophora teres f. teres]|nr:hypothetical protein P3342_005340 [Pyrenophora teres f. teres]